jgi:hypothetical protein
MQISIRLVYSSSVTHIISLTLKDGLNSEAISFGKILTLVEQPLQSGCSVLCSVMTCVYHD